MSDQFWVMRQKGRGGCGWDAGMLWLKSDYPESAYEGPYIPYGGAAKRLTDLRVIITRMPIRGCMWTDASDILIQDGIRDMFLNEGFAGFISRPARVRPKIRRDDYDPNIDYEEVPGIRRDVAEKLAIPAYSEILVTGWGGVAPETANIKHVPGTGDWVGNPDWSKIVNREQWDGSDFLIVWPYPLFHMVTDRVAKFVKKHKISGTGLVRADRTERFPYDWGAKPGRLSDYMPGERVQQILSFPECRDLCMD